MSRCADCGGRLPLAIQDLDREAGEICSACWNRRYRPVRALLWTAFSLGCVAAVLYAFVLLLVRLSGG